jgi:hypothetical protein
LQATIDATGNRTVKKAADRIDISPFVSLICSSRCDKASSAIKVMAQDYNDNISYWNIITDESADTFKQHTITLASPDSNNGSDADLSDVVYFGFDGLEANQVYIFDEIKVICGMNVAVGKADPGGYFAPVYLTNTPLSKDAFSSPELTAPTSNPRIDLLCISGNVVLTGSAFFLIGTESASPSAPSYPTNPGVMPICEIYLPTTATKIMEYLDKDENPTEGYIRKDVRPFARQ